APLNVHLPWPILPEALHAPSLPVPRATVLRAVFPRMGSPRSFEPAQDDALIRRQGKLLPLSASAPKARPAPGPICSDVHGATPLPTTDSAASAAGSCASSRPRRMPRKAASASARASAANPV